VRRGNPALLWLMIVSDAVFLAALDVKDEMMLFIGT
jgi:hypothetical protein